MSAFHPPRSIDHQLCRYPRIFQEVICKKTEELNSLALENIFAISTPTQIKELLFDGLIGPIRNYIESVSADEQCKKAQIEFNPKTTVCWLCGCVIGNQPKACEHKFPALRAIMLNGIITTKAIRNRFTEEEITTQLLKLETERNYDWAHENCNGSGGKGGLVLFKYDKDAKAFTVDEDKCNLLVGKIRALREDCYKGKYQRSIYENLINVITKLLESVNREYGEFKRACGNDNAIKYYAEYTLEIIQKHVSQDAIKYLRDEKSKMEHADFIAKQEEEILIEIAKQQQLLQDAENKIKFNFASYITSLQEYNNQRSRIPLSPDYIEQFIIAAVENFRQHKFLFDTQREDIDLVEIINVSEKLLLELHSTEYGTAISVNILNCVITAQLYKYFKNKGYKPNSRMPNTPVYLLNSFSNLFISMITIKKTKDEIMKIIKTICGNFKYNRAEYNEIVHHIGLEYETFKRELEPPPMMLIRTSSLPGHRRSRSRSRSRDRERARSHDPRGRDRGRYRGRDRSGDRGRERGGGRYPTYSGINKKKSIVTHKNKKYHKKISQENITRKYHKKISQKNITRKYHKIHNRQF